LEVEILGRVKDLCERQCQRFEAAAEEIYPRIENLLTV
jgi:hypothetical protein